MITTTTNKAGLRDLLAGDVDFGCGVRIKAITDEKKQVIAVEFEHDIYGVSFDPIGVCSKILPIRQVHNFHPVKKKGKRRKKGGTFRPWSGRTWQPATLGARAQWWFTRVGRKHGLSLLPSVVCPEHNIHGFISNGGWEPMRAFAANSYDPERWAEKIAAAEDLIAEFGYGYEGALAALASKMHPPSSRATGRGYDYRPRDMSHREHELGENNVTHNGDRTSSGDDGRTSSRLVQADQH